MSVVGLPNRCCDLFPNREWTAEKKNLPCGGWGGCRNAEHPCNFHLIASEMGDRESRIQLIFQLFKNKEAVMQQSWPETVNRWSAEEEERILSWNRSVLIHLAQASEWEEFHARETRRIDYEMINTWPLPLRWAAKSGYVYQDLMAWGASHSKKDVAVKAAIIALVWFTGKAVLSSKF